MTTGETNQFLHYSDAARRPADAKLVASTLSLWEQDMPVYLGTDDHALYLQPKHRSPGPAAFAIRLADVQELALQEISRVTIARVLVLALFGIVPAALAPLWKKKEQRLTIDFTYKGGSASLALDGEPWYVRTVYDALRLRRRDLHQGFPGSSQPPKRWNRR